MDLSRPETAVHEQVGRAFSAGRRTSLQEIAAVVSWLTDAESQPMTGQVINAEAGFRRT